MLNVVGSGSEGRGGAGWVGLAGLGKAIREDIGSEGQ